MVEWLVYSVEALKNNKDVHLYIKPHPAEVLDSSSSLKGVEQLLREHFGNLPENVTIIEPELRIKTYDLFEFIDLGVVFSGTLGFEMTLADVPVAAVGKTPMNSLGFCFEPKTHDEYWQCLLGEAPPFLQKGYLKLFAYFYFIKTTMPWTISEQAFDDRSGKFAFDCLDDLMPGQNEILDHLCNSILYPEHVVRTIGLSSWVHN